MTLGYSSSRGEGRVTHRAHFHRLGRSLCIPDNCARILKTRTQSYRLCFKKSRKAMTWHNIGLYGHQARPSWVALVGGRWWCWKTRLAAGPPLARGEPATVTVHQNLGCPHHFLLCQSSTSTLYEDMYVFLVPHSTEVLSS